MISSLQIPVKQWKLNRWAILALLFYAGILYYALRNHIIWQSVNVLLGLVALPVVTVIRTVDKGSIRYAVAAILLALCCLALPVKTICYGAIACSVLFVIESFVGKTNLLPLIVVGMMSPIFQYMADIFSFPIRLQLTTMAGKAMQLMGSAVQVKGNMIHCNGHEFSVDPACMGLNMLVTALLLQVLLVAVYQKKYGRTGAWWQVFLLLGLVMAFNILSNLIRIVCLVQLNILPGTTLHEVMGIICFLVYVVLPASLFTRWLIQRHGKATIVHLPPVSNTNTVKQVIVHLVLAVTMLMAARSVVQRDNVTADQSAAIPAVEGYSVQRIANDVVKLENDQSLVYIKPIAGFYSADHNPMICWRGSGYAFTQVEKSEVNGQFVYMALLQNGQDQLYTAWWYDNGSNRTIDQFAWRRDALQNNTKYALINVTAASREKLEAAIQHIQQEQPFRKLL
ncbi:exosortase N [Paraflavitalea soli]|uniref:Exosortase N n=1 Tax=Paraflavitalea soli TaxID=2315862 RepID=A0A3B7N1G8_9BACT|nr:exosortase N [Paraflavitalea soli]AXY76231.1 exosortase N [Paraflavitalea soli]